MIPLHIYRDNKFQSTVFHVSIPESGTDIVVPAIESTETFERYTISEIIHWPSRDANESSYVAIHVNGFPHKIERSN